MKNLKLTKALCSCPLYLVMVTIFVTESSSQSIFLNGTDGFYGDYGKLSNNLSNSQLFNVGYSALGHYDLTFNYLDTGADNSEGILSGYLSIHIRNKNARLKSRGSVMLGMAAIESHLGFLLGFEGSAILDSGSNSYLAGDLGGGFSIFKVGEGNSAHIKVEPALSIGIILAHENRISVIYGRPALGFSREVFSVSLSLGIMFKFPGGYQMMQERRNSQGIVRGE
jgi:hypothetical protein